MIFSMWETAKISALKAALKLSNIDVAGGLAKAKSETLSQIQPIVNTVIIPIIGVVLVIILVCLIAGAASKKKQGQEYSDKLAHIAVVVVILIVVGTAPLWMWSMAGIN